jgi:uncharacterized cupin superfamily protein
MRRVNVLQLEPAVQSPREGYRYAMSRVGADLGAEKIGGSVYDIPEGESTFPYHFHHGMEEWGIVIDGTPALRSPDGERQLTRGDVVCFPPGPAGAHKFRGPGRLLMISANRLPEAAEYPDSGKIGVMPARKIFRLGDATEYWEGE